MSSTGADPKESEFLKRENPDRMNAGRPMWGRRISSDKSLGLAIDLGTSGFRAQFLDLSKGGDILFSMATRRHPLPGANVMDHLHFALEAGTQTARQLIVTAVNRILAAAGCDPEAIHRMAVCGNPIQLSLFQGLEIRDLAYAGGRKLKKLGVTSPNRNARMINAREIPELVLSPETGILIPPAVQHEIGADALALILRAGLETRSDICLAIDYGTNAEMALAVDGAIYTGSAAAGPALEGQHISHGMLALPGAISDVNRIDASTDETSSQWQTTILDQRLIGTPGEFLHMGSGRVFKQKRKPRGITGTGVVALLAEAVSAGLIQRPRITTPDGHLHLSSRIHFSQTDLSEAGKAIGAIRAGMITLCRAADISPADIETMFMAGAAGTGMDPLKARAVGLLPSCAKRVCQVGNTSLSAARDLLLIPEALSNMQKAADRLRTNHCMFARSEAFKNAYLLELSYWDEGLPFSEYNRFLERFGLPAWPDPRDQARPGIHRESETVGPEGEKWIVTEPADSGATVSFSKCRGTARCVASCPETALSQHPEKSRLLTLNLSLCRGPGCRICETVCPERALKWDRFPDALHSNPHGPPPE